MSAKRWPKSRKSLSHTKRGFRLRKSRRQSRTGESIISKVFGKNRKSKRAKKQTIPRVMTGWRLWLFRIIALTILPVLLLVVLELSLRIVGYGFSPKAITTFRADGKDTCCDNVKFAWRFFPRSIARESEPFIFPTDKPDGSYRIFILGASAAQGTPEPAFSFGRILREMLHEKYPAMNFEVINTAMTAINSHVVLQIAKDCACYDPDLFIVYLGNNEVTGPYGPGTVFTLPLANLSVIRTSIALRATRLGQLLAGLADSVGARRSTPRVWRGLGMFLDNQVRADTSHLEKVYRNFRRNLEDIRRISTKSGSKAVFCTVGSNLKDSPPFASLHRADLTPAEMKKWDDIYREGAEYELLANHADAIECYLAAAKIDDRYADLQFRLARCYWAAAEYKKARVRYIRARELDTLRFRADTRINDIIRDVAGDSAAEGIYLADTIEVLEKNSPHAIPGKELFYEHVHLNFKGNYVLAKAVLEQVEKTLPPNLEEIQGTDKRQMLTEDQCAQRLAYTGWDRYLIANKVLNDFMKRPPFTNQLDQQERVTQMEQNIEDLKRYLAPEAIGNVVVEYRKAIQKSPSDWRLRWKYGKLLTESLKDHKGAAEQVRLVRQYLPHSYMAYTALGAIAREMGDINESIAQYQKAIQINPTCAHAHYYLARAFRKQGRNDESIEHYYKTLQLNPIFVPAYNHLGEILLEQGKIDQSIRLHRKGLLLAPDSSILHCNLGILLHRQGNRTEAIKELNAAVKIEPNSPEIRKILEAVLKKGN